LRRHWKKLIAGIGAIAAMMLLGTGALLWFTRVERAPSVTIDLLGFTNRIGPHAIFAITNRSAAAIVFDAQCVVAYTTTRGMEPRQPIWFEGNKVAVTRLMPNHGFVQEVFVFPGGGGEWQLACNAAYTSVWVDIRRSIEKRCGKLLRIIGIPVKSKSWHKIHTEWRNCPP